MGNSLGIIELLKAVHDAGIAASRLSPEAAEICDSYAWIEKSVQFAGSTFLEKLHEAGYVVEKLRQELPAKSSWQFTASHPPRTLGEER